MMFLVKGAAYEEKKEIASLTLKKKKHELLCLLRKHSLVYLLKYILALFSVWLR